MAVLAMAASFLYSINQKMDDASILKIQEKHTLLRQQSTRAPAARVLL
jgi:hypothetical protein